MQGLSPIEQKHLILSVGTHRGARPLSPIEAARYIQRALEAGVTPVEIAEFVAFDGTTMIGRFQRLLSLAPEIQHLVAWGSPTGGIGFTHAFELARLASKEDQAALATAILEHSLPSTEVRQIVQLRIRSKRPIGECVSEVIAMRPHIVVRHVFIGTITDAALEQRLGHMTQGNRDQLLKAALLERLPELKVATGRLGTNRFTLVGGDELGKAVHGPLEENVVRALQLGSASDGV